MSETIVEVISIVIIAYSLFKCCYRRRVLDFCVLALVLGITLGVWPFQFNKEIAGISLSFIMMVVFFYAYRRRKENLFLFGAFGFFYFLMSNILVFLSKN